MDMTRKTVLVAARPELLQVAQKVYMPPEFTAIFCLTLQEAVAALDRPLDLIACGVHFGDGELYDFLRLAKAHPTARNVPFLVVDSGQEELYHYVHQSVDIASKALGAAAVIPITRWRNEMGDEQAFETYRKTIRKLLWGNP
jgi:hypothetical protein